jgi:nitrogenase molybdenum-iron protein alpha/beta subunit
MARKTTLPTRENRLGAISAWLGPAAALAAEWADGGQAQRIRTFTQAAADDIVQALRLLGGIEGAGIVVHGARGCAGLLVFEAPHGCWAVTNLNQRDTIMGSDTALARTVRALYRRHRPWAVFVVGTPVVAINNDDPHAIAGELGDELNIPVLAVRSDGFRSRVAATGFDAAAQAALRLVSGGIAVASRVNVVAVTTGPAARAHVAGLLDDLGLEANILPAGAGRDAFTRAGSAALTVSLEPDAGDALERGLEDSHGIARLVLPPPVGLAGTGDWLAAIGQATGTARAARVIHQAQAGRLGELVAARPLAGAPVFLALSPAEAFAAVGLVEDLGGRIAGLAVDHMDIRHAGSLAAFAASYPDVPVQVAAGQPFETASLWARQPPGLFIGAPEAAALAAGSGSPAVAVRPGDLLGYRGVALLARQARKALANPSYVRHLAGAAPPPYRESWLRRSPDWHVKREVR